jgi:transforming growth factor-beta-induced protein
MKMQTKAQGLKSLVGFAAVVGLTVAGSSQSFAAEKDIVQTAAGAGSFKTLVAAVKAAGLAQTLMGKGPFTIFAPTDAAFAKLPKGTVANLLKPENKATLASILKYHVVPGRVTARKVMMLPSGSKVKTVNGESFAVRLNNGVDIDPFSSAQANVTKTDIMASNGVIHVIDRVILPPSVVKAMAKTNMARARM